MSSSTFEKLLMFVGRYLVKMSNREPLSPSCRLAITLRFLATGDSYQSLSLAFRIGVSTVCKVVAETCDVIWNILQPKVLKSPTTNNLKEIAQDFCDKWSLPNCIGAIDGKHIVIQAPNNSGSNYFNYKKTFSIILFGVCDANYMFTYVDIGAFGSKSDGGVLNNSQFGRKLWNNELGLPEPKALPLDNRNEKIPHFFVGDEAFPLRLNLMRPFSRPRNRNLSEEQNIFNYRLSRARRIIENTFGIMVARFRILHRVISNSPTTTMKIVKAIICLHNFIRKENDELYMQEVSENEATLRLNSALQEVSFRTGARNASLSALEMRNYLKEYFVGPGASLAPWQWDTVRRT